MTLELLFKDKLLQRKPWLLFFIAIIVCCTSMALSLLMYNEFVSIFTVVFCAIPLITIFTEMIKTQEKTLSRAKHLRIKNIILVQFIFLFIGLAFTYSLWYVAVPDNITEPLFRVQINSIYNLEGPVGFALFSKEAELYSCSSLGVTQEQKEELDVNICQRSDYDHDNKDEIVLMKDDKAKYVITETGKVKYFNIFIANLIFFNNIGVLALVFLTSFIFGAGGIFIITWNASIVGVFIGDAVRRTTNFIAGDKVFAYLIETPRVLSGLILHGFFEFSGFFCGAIAGGILSVALVKHKIKSKHFRVILLDSMKLMLLSVLLIVIGAIIEGIF